MTSRERHRRIAAIRRRHRRLTRADQRGELEATELEAVDLVDADDHVTVRTAEAR